MSMESTYLVCSETLVFLLFVGGMMTLVIDNWLNEFIGFVIFYCCNVLSFVVMACCTYCVFQGYLYKSVLLVARSALIFNVVNLSSFLLVALEWSKDDKPHEMHALLFMRSSNDNSALTIPYIVIGISLCTILVILHCCIYQQLHHTFEELRSEPHVKLYNYINMLIESIAESGMDTESKEDSGTESKEDSITDLRADSNTLRRILNMFADVKDAQESDSILQLIQVVVRTFLLMLIVLYDTKACLESTTNGYEELLPSMVFILYLAVQDGVENVYNKQQERGTWEKILLLSFLFLVLSYLGVCVSTLVFYIEDRDSDFLSDIRKTWLNNVLVSFMTLDFVLYACRFGVLLSHRRQPESLTATVVSEEDRDHEKEVGAGDLVWKKLGENDSTSHAAGTPIQPVASSASDLGGKIRVLGFANGGHVTFNMRQTYKKNK